MIQLTEHPLPVEGRMVDQSPLPGAKVHRSSTLTCRSGTYPEPPVAGMTSFSWRSSLMTT
jgi:hypothetical protein